MFLSFFDFAFYFWFVLFFPIIFVSIYIPGLFVVNKLKAKNNLLTFVLSISVGIALWGLQGYIFGYLQMRLLTYVYILTSLIYIFYNFRFVKNHILCLRKLVNKKNLGVILLILIGSISQTLTVFFSGFKYFEGVKLFGNSSVDGVMHLAYIQSIVNDFPPKEPGMAGEIIKNYHYWSDMVMADLAKVWGVPIVHLFFQFMPILLSVVIGVTAYVLIREWGGSKRFAFWFVFLIYFASDAAYLILMILQKPLGFYTPAIDSGVLQFLNMPHVFGKLIFLAGLLTFHLWIKEKRILHGVITVMLFSSLFGFKVYFGIFAAIGMSMYLLVFVLRKILVTKSLDFINQLFLYLFFALISAAVFLPHNYGAGGFVYVYLEWPRSLLGAGSIDWRDWWLRRQVYEAYNNIRNLIILDVIAVVIAFVSIYGTRLIGFFITKGLLKFLGWEKVLFLIPPLIVFHALGLFTIQASGGVNVFNFFSVSSVILSIFASYLVSKINPKGYGVVIIILFIFLTVPRTIDELRGNLTRVLSSDYRLISNDELEAFDFIQKLKDDNVIVQASPANSLDQETPYVSFFNNKSSYLGGGSLLSTHNIDIDARKEFLDEVFKSTSIVDFKSKLEQRGIGYVYLQKVPEQELNFVLDEAYLEKVFENSTVLVLKVKE